MRKRIATMVAVALALIAGPTIAHAQETQQEKPDAEVRSERFALIDHNSDGVIDHDEFVQHREWLAEHRETMIQDPARHAMMMERWEKVMGEHHPEMKEGMMKEPMAQEPTAQEPMAQEPMAKDRPENWKSSMDVTKTDDFEEAYFRLFDRDEDESVSREEWNEAFDILYPDTAPETDSDEGMNR